MEFRPWRIVTLLVSLSSILAPLLTPPVSPPLLMWDLTFPYIQQLSVTPQGSSDPSLAQSQRRLRLASAHSGRPVGNLPLGRREYAEQ